MSKITITEQRFLLESNAIEGEYSEEAMNDAVFAWEFAKYIAELNFDNILMIHRLLMKRTRPDIAGILRKVPVRVGNYFPPNPGEVRRLLMMWVWDYGKAKNRIDIIKAHIKFEKIHPFEDGNGRVGRIILNWQKLKAKLPIMVIEEKKKNEYYHWFVKGYRVK